MAERLVDLGVGDEQRGCQAHGVGPHGVDQQALGRAAATTSAATASAASTAASSSPAPRTPTTPGRPASPAPAGPGRAGPAPQTSSASITARVARAAAMARGWPPKVVAWSPGPKAAATSARAQHAPTGMPLPSALAMVTTSGRSGPAWKANQCAGPPEPGLDLVEHEQDAPLVAQGPHPGQVVRGGGHHPALALDGLEQHPGHGAGAMRLGQRRQVVVGDVDEPLGQRLEGLVLGRLAGGGQGGQGPAVERVPGRDHHVAARARPSGGPA